MPPKPAATARPNASLVAHFLPEILKRAIANAVAEGEAEVDLGFPLKDGT